MEKQQNPFPLPVGRTGLLLVLITASLAAASSTQRDKVHVYSLTEEQPPDTFVANLLIDSGLAARYSANVLSTLTFVFLKEVENLELFVLDPLNGILRTGRSVDRDVICPGQLNCALRLDIAVQPPAYFEVIKVELTIVDINDNAPKFDSPRHHLVVSEASAPGERFRLPGAVDVDSVPNGVVEYLLLSTTSAFQLDVTQDPAGGGSRPKDVWLVLLEDLDREREDRFELLVAGYDGGVPRRSAMLTVDVHVEDANDNVPKFDRSAYNVSVSESTPIGATVVRVFASDADVGRNGHVRYRFSQRSGANYGDLFAVDPESGDVVLLQALDHAAAASYSLGVVAEDQGEFASPALAALVVTVVDINDHAPQIVVDVLSAGGSVEVAENADAGTFVAHVSTLDKDAGDNGLVRCSINDNNNFRLTSIYDGEYKLVTAAAFDRETVTRFDVVIRCHDMGEPRRHVSKVVIVNVADVNDNCPMFTHAVYEAAVDENQPPGSFVVRVSAHDPDTGSNGDVVYLLDSDADQRFHVDSASGVVTVLTTLDREAVADAETIEFHVLAANRGESGGPMMARAAVRVRVADVDDEPPRFRSDRYVMAVAENLPPRTEVGRVTAVDGDLPPFNAFSFLLSNSSSSHSRTFAIDPRLGTIFTKRSLDREKQSHYDVTVEVVSNTVAVTRDVTRVAIDVIDANDNAPNVTFPNEFDNTVSVASTVKVHEVVCTVRGHDLDLGSNSELVYEVIDGNGTTFFGVDPLNGHVTSLRDLVRSVNETYTLVLRVRDSGTPVQYSTATLHVAVTDGNQSPIIPAVAAENQWTWLLADARLLVVAGVVVAICLVFVAILTTAILLVRRRSRRRRAKVQLAMMKTEMVTMQGRKDDDDNDDGDSINQMKMMMNDGKMVRMKDVSFTELNTNAPCITGKQFSGVSGSGYGRETKLSARLHHVTSVGPPVTFDAETDSGCADVSHCNDDLSSGSERSNKEVETGLKDRTLSCNDRRFPQCSNASQKSKLDAHSSNHVMPSHVTPPFASGCCVKNDGKLSASVSPFRSSQSPSSSSSSSTSLPMSSTLLSANRKSVRFADDDDDDRKFVTLDDSKSNELCKRERNQNGVDQPLPLCSNSNRPEASDVIGKIPTYAHQYPTHVGMTTFLPDDGSLV